MKIDNDDVSYVSDTEENQRSLSFCHITRVPRVNTHSHAHRDSRTCSAHVFRLPDGNRRNSRVKRDSLPDITRKANAALSHRWRVISRIRVSLPRVTGLSPFARTNFRTHTTRGTCLRFPVSRGNYENVEESMEDPRQRIDSGKRANENWFTPVSRDSHGTRSGRWTRHPRCPPYGTVVSPHRLPPERRDGTSNSPCAACCADWSRCYTGGGSRRRRRRRRQAAIRIAANRQDGGTLNFSFTWPARQRETREKRSVSRVQRERNERANIRKTDSYRYRRYRFGESVIDQPCAEQRHEHQRRDFKHCWQGNCTYICNLALDCDRRDWASPREAVPPRAARAQTALPSLPLRFARTIRKIAALLRSPTPFSLSLSLSLSRLFVARPSPLGPRCTHTINGSRRDLIPHLLSGWDENASAHGEGEGEWEEERERERERRIVQALWIQFADRNFLLNKVCYVSSFSRIKAIVEPLPLTPETLSSSIFPSVCDVSVASTANRPTRRWMLRGKPQTYSTVLTLGRYLSLSLSFSVSLSARVCSCPSRIGRTCPQAPGCRTV